MTVSPPRPSGPHLNALRAFEAAARLKGFKTAAAELCVTPGAVSQHVKALEHWVGAPLFERRTQGVELTRLGRAVIDDFSDAFDLLGLAQRKLRAGAGGAEIRIAALPAVAQLWLAPRMSKIRRHLPGITLSVTALETPPNLAREMYDLSLFIRDPAKVPGGIVLAPDGIMPVCSPEIAKLVESPAELDRHYLLHDHVWASDWDDWYAASGYRRKPGSAAGATYSLYALAVTEALAGAGLLIGHKCLIGDHLSDGRLVAPFGDAMPTGRALVLEGGQPASAGAEKIVQALRKTGT